MANKNKYGQYFTIPVIAEFMVGLIDHEKDCKVLEPSCGEGIFLDMLVKHGYNNVSAYEIDLGLKTKHKFVKYQSFLSVPTKEKYSVIIGNPPYIRWKNIEPELKKELEDNILWKQYFNNLCDYLFIFILKSIEHLEDNGELIFICTEYWMNTTHSISLRNYMCSNGYIEEIYHFKETPLFEKVTASFIIFKYIKSTKPRETITLYKYNKEKELPILEDLKNRICFNKINIPQFQMSSRWILASQDTQEKLFNFERSCAKRDDLFHSEFNKIGDFCDIGNGLFSGLDTAFQISDISELNVNERRALINVIKAKDLHPYLCAKYTKYIFIQEKISTDEFAIKYPHFEKHFTPYISEFCD